jgi:hypothetical protein
MKPKMFWLSSMPHGKQAYSSLFLIPISFKRLGLSSFMGSEFCY